MIGPDLAKRLLLTASSHSAPSRSAPVAKAAAGDPCSMYQITASQGSASASIMARRRCAPDR